MNITITLTQKDARTLLTVLAMAESTFQQADREKIRELAEYVELKLDQITPQGKSE